MCSASGLGGALFRRQIRNGGPITITHPDIIRYFMLIPEAAQLVIQAGAMARGGEVFVLDMGEPVRIADPARSMVRLSGLTEKTAEHPRGDIEIKAVGLRPGEKLEELLIGDDVAEHPSAHHVGARASRRSRTARQDATRAAPSLRRRRCRRDAAPVAQPGAGVPPRRGSERRGGGLAQITFARIRSFELSAPTSAPFSSTTSTLVMRCCSIRSAASTASASSRTVFGLA